MCWSAMNIRILQKIRLLDDYKRRFILRENQIGILPSYSKAIVIHHAYSSSSSDSSSDEMEGKKRCRKVDFHLPEEESNSESENEGTKYSVVNDEDRKKQERKMNCVEKKLERKMNSVKKKLERKMNSVKKKQRKKLELKMM